MAMPSRWASSDPVSGWCRVGWVTVVMALWVGALAGAAAAQDSQEGAFVDDDGSVHEQALDALAARGYLDGTECGAGQICPSQPLKRWEMAVWLGRALADGEPPALSGSRFADVDVDEWWAPHVERFADLGVTAGCRADPLSYCPDKSVTRAQMATFFVRAFGLRDAPPRGFADTAGNTHEGNIDALAAAGVTAGCRTDPLSYCPDRSVTRAQMATFLARALGLISATLPPAWSVFEIIEPPDHNDRPYDQYHEYYTQAVALGPLHIIADADVNPEALQRTALIIRQMLANRPDVIEQ